MAKALCVEWGFGITKPADIRCLCPPSGDER